MKSSFDKMTPKQMQGSFMPHLPSVGRALGAQGHRQGLVRPPGLKLGGGLHLETGGPVIMPHLTKLRQRKTHLNFHMGL